jgi:hypothetical protein
MTAASDRRDELHDALDRMISELDPGADITGLGISAACGTERLLYSWVAGAGEIRTDLLTDPGAVERAFAAGSVNMASGDVTE